MPSFMLILQHTPVPSTLPKRQNDKRDHTEDAEQGGHEQVVGDAFITIFPFGIFSAEGDEGEYSRDSEQQGNDRGELINQVVL